MILDSKKHPVGYITYDVSGGHHAFELQMSMTLMEIGYTTPAVFPDVLEHLAKIASKNDLENFYTEWYKLEEERIIGIVFVFDFIENGIIIQGNCG